MINWWREYYYYLKNEWPNYFRAVNIFMDIFVVLIGVALACFVLLLFIVYPLEMIAGVIIVGFIVFLIPFVVSIWMYTRK